MKILLTLLIIITLSGCKPKNEVELKPGKTIIELNLTYQKKENSALYYSSSANNLFNEFELKFKEYFDANNPTKIELLITNNVDTFRVYLLRTTPNYYELRILYDEKNSYDFIVMEIENDGIIRSGMKFNMRGNWALKEMIK